MMKQNDTAQVAVKAEPCLQKHDSALGGAAKAFGLPTQDQVMQQACAVLAYELQCHLSEAIEVEWRDDYFDCVNAAELALMTVERLQKRLPVSGDEFEAEWCRITGVVRVAVAAFPSKHSRALHFLKGADASSSYWLDALERVQRAASLHEAGGHP